MNTTPLPMFENFMNEDKFTDDQIQKRLDFWGSDKGILTYSDKNNKVTSKNEIFNWFTALPSSLIYIVAKDQGVTNDIEDPFKAFGQSLGDLVDLVFDPLIDDDQWDEINNILTSAWDTFDKDREKYAKLELKKMGPVDEAKTDDIKAKLDSGEKVTYNKGLYLKKNGEDYGLYVTSDDSLAISGKNLDYRTPLTPDINILLRWADKVYGKMNEERILDPRQRGKWEDLKSDILTDLEALEPGERIEKIYKVPTVTKGLVDEIDKFANELKDHHYTS